jgi:mycothiol synthase
MTHPGPLTASCPLAPEGYRLRAGTGDDAPDISIVLEEAFAEPWGVDRVLSTLLAADDVPRVWVITDGLRVVGTASERLLPAQYPDAGYVHYVGVASSARGHRLGQVVTEACLYGFFQRGLGAAVLETDDFRLPAVRTYLRIGFVPEYRSDLERSAWSAVFRELEHPNPTTT